MSRRHKASQIRFRQALGRRRPRQDLDGSSMR
jgi:hypothetical protein